MKYTGNSSALTTDLNRGLLVLGSGMSGPLPTPWLILVNTVDFSLLSILSAKCIHFFPVLNSHPSHCSLSWFSPSSFSWHSEHLFPVPLLEISWRLRFWTQLLTHRNCHGNSIYPWWSPWQVISSTDPLLLILNFKMFLNINQHAALLCSKSRFSEMAHKNEPHHLSTRDSVLLWEGE